MEMRLGSPDPAVVTDIIRARRSQRAPAARHTRLLVIGDLVCAFVALATVVLTRVGLGQFIPIEDFLLGLALTIMWPGVMALVGAYGGKTQGEGAEEFRVVTQGGMGLIAATAIGAYATQATVARSYVMAMMPLATLITLVFRHRMRRRLHRLRARGERLRRVVAVGHPASVLDLVAQFRRQPYHGMRVVAACLPSGDPRLCREVGGVPVLGDFDDVPAVVDKAEADAVAVLACPELDGAALRRLAWGIEPRGTDLFVASALMDVAGPRIGIRLVAGMPLLHVEHPDIDGIRQVVKSAFDKVMAALVLAVVAVPMLTIAVVIRTTSPGPALFRQRRVGRHGREFHMLKFRTMVADAERLKQTLFDRNESDGVLFKIRNDPRITRVGALLRRYSLDELPQLLNVLRGEMSLVGPRPPLPVEVERYGADVRRRLVVKPGMTGLWQVSGRSDLTWEESVRLDLRYVENWSLMLDLQLLWKTWSAVTRGEGAY